MSTQQEEFVALRDSAGRYYLLPRATVEAARVADESIVRLEALLRGDASGAGEDVSGFVVLNQPTVSSFGAQTFAIRGIIIVGGHQTLQQAGIRFAP
jgi:hypothetical protein